MSDQITELDIDQIQKRIPHRPPMLLIEWVGEIVPDHSAVGVKMLVSASRISPGISPTIRSCRAS